MQRRIPLPEFFFLVETRQLDRLFTADYIEQATNLQPEKLKVLLEELQIYLGNRREEVEDSFENRILAKMKEYSEQGLSLPMKVIEFPPKFSQEPTRILDKDKLLGGEITWQLYPLYELRNDIKARLSETLTEKTGNLKPIKEQSKKPTSSRVIDFSYFLTPDGQKLIPELQKKYNNGPKKNFAVMIRALERLELLTNYTFVSGHTELNESLKKTFSGVGSRQHMMEHLDIYKNPVGSNKEELETHVKDISKMLFHLKERDKLNK